MAAVPLGDDVKKDGENIWISRMPIELARREAQPVSSSETRAHRTSSERRKVRAREARREAARRNRGKPRERCKAGSREGSEPRKGGVTGVGRKTRSEVVRGASRWLPWSRRGRPGQGLSDTTPARRQRVIADVAPRSTGGFGRTVTRGCVASRHLFAVGSFSHAPVTTVRGAPRAPGSECQPPPRHSQPRGVGSIRRSGSPGCLTLCRPWMAARSTKPDPGMLRCCRSIKICG
jgi:hypothetical protein